MSTISGILLGFGAAVAQSLSYLFSGTFVRKFPDSAVLLLVSSHILMGLFSAALLFVFWPEIMPQVGSYGLALIGTAFFYLSAQICLFLALRQSDASRVSLVMSTEN